MRINQLLLIYIKNENSEMSYMILFTVIRTALILIFQSFDTYASKNVIWKDTLLPLNIY